MTTERLYHIVAINEQTGTQSYVTAYPDTHKNCMTIKSKLTNHAQIRYQLAEVGQSMKMYCDLKRQVETLPLFYRMGDYYELFFNDAVQFAPLLEITLMNKRGVDMAGIPVHALDATIAKLLALGIKVAVSEFKGAPQDYCEPGQEIRTLTIHEPQN